jgi:choline dehydrogenase-like flavoprotein
LVHDLLEITPDDSSSHDVCIIGAGAAGIVLAIELARMGKRVLLLDGGGIDVEEASQDPYQSEVAGLQHNGVHVGRFRSLGGSTTRWGGQILELNEEDFASRPWIPGSGWPLSKQELAPYYLRALELEGLSGATLEDDAVWKEIGISPPRFRNFETFFSRWCPETNFARLHQDALHNHPSITVWLHANAVAPVMEGDRFLGVNAKTLTGISHTFKADAFVWCMGGIESCRFFLQPELAAMPWHRNGWVGRNFQDHLMCSSARIEPIDKSQFLSIFANVFNRGYKYQPKFRLSFSEQKRHGILNVASLIFFQTDSVAIEGELKATAKKLLRGRLGDVSGSEMMQLLRNAGLFARQTWSYARAHRAYIPPDACFELGVQCEQPPESTSSIQLGEGRDRLGMYRTRINWQISDLELESIRVCTEKATESLKDLARHIPDPDLGAPGFSAKCGDQYHHMGGMKMAVSAADGVVDTALKLHGTANGYICSSAIFPSSGFSNPTHTVIALAIRLAEHLARQ